MPAYEATQTLIASEHISRNARAVVDGKSVFYTSILLTEGNRWCGSDATRLESIVGVLMPAGDEITLRAS